MKKLLTVLSVAALIAACSAPATNDEAAKRKQLQDYKQQMHDLKEQIDALENELKAFEVAEVINVKVYELQPETFEHFLEVTGKVEAEMNVDVSPESAGVITDVFVTEGQVVAKGFVMAKLSTEILERSLEELNIQLELATTNFTRQKNLWDQNIGSEMQFLQAKNNKESLEKRIESVKAQMDMAQIKSPVSGIVDVVYQKKGHIGSPQVPFAKVVNISQIKVYADISESYLTKVKKGDKVQVSFPALSKDVEASVQQIGNTIDPGNRTFRIRIDMGNPGNLIKPNLVSVVKIRDYVSENAIVIPSLLIKDDFKGSYTYIAENAGGKTIARKVYVKTGVTNNNMTEVTEGLQPGMQIISEGHTQVGNETEIRY